MTKETIQITQEIKKSEEANIKIRYYTLDGQYPEIFMCPGDLIILCNLLHDYSSLLNYFAEEKKGLEKAQYEYHVGRCKKIQRLFELKLGYNVEETIKQCEKKNKRKQDDIGEDALTLATRKRS